MIAATLAFLRAVVVTDRLAGDARCYIRSYCPEGTSGERVKRVPSGLPVGYSVAESLDHKAFLVSHGLSVEQGLRSIR